MDMATWLIPSQRAPDRRTPVLGAPVIYKNSLIASMEGTHNSQIKSPLFSLIPAEIRNAIFMLALTAYDDLSAPYPTPNVHYNRPGYRCKHRIDTSLLPTCRRIYTETHDLPIRLNEHVFWFKKDRGPPGVHYCDNPMAYFYDMTNEQRQAVETIHLFTELSWLEGTFPMVFEALPNLLGFRPKNLKITVRHGDWWFWGYMSPPLLFRKGWTESLSRIHGLKTLEVELESVEKDKFQLEMIEDEMRSWRIDAGNGNVFSIEDTTQIPPYSYVGPDLFGDMLYDHDRGVWGPLQAIPRTNLSKKLNYTVYTTRWKVKNSW